MNKIIDCYGNKGTFLFYWAGGLMATLMVNGTHREYHRTKFRFV